MSGGTSPLLSSSWKVGIPVGTTVEPAKDLVDVTGVPLGELRASVVGQAVVDEVVLREHDQTQDQRDV